ncbi:MAG: hypothetical protein M3319_08430 [Actinomycetota bacterium]|nr:hypothetical protein [Actinomycetota bacterium]MDQ3900453.1 hypothetical protein [Actinomycetota bacterium]
MSATLPASMAPGNLLDAEGVGAAVVEQQSLVLSGVVDLQTHPIPRSGALSMVRFWVVSLPIWMLCPFLRGRACRVGYFV